MNAITFSRLPIGQWAQTYRVTTFTFEVNDVIDHVTIRFFMCYFLLVVDFELSLYL